MLVYLLRPPAADGHLAYDARQAVRALGNTIRLQDEPSFDRFVTSPAPSAVQTAELFAERTDYVGVIEVLPLLAGPTPAEVLVPLFARNNGVVIVADEPLLATLGAFFVGRPTFPPAVPGQVSVIQDRQPQWFLRPGEMKRALLVS